MNCLHCHQDQTLPEELFCKHCLRNFYQQLLSRLEVPMSILEVPMVSFGLYQGALASFVKSAKSQPFGHLPTPYRRLTQSLVLHWSTELFPADYVLHVPGQPIRCFLQCDFSEFIAETLGGALQLPVLKNCLRRSWLSPQQKTLNGKLRRTQWSQSKHIWSHAAGPLKTRRRVLLVDDVCTTGSSLRTSIQALRSAGFEPTQCLTFARSTRFFYD